MNDRGFFEVLGLSSSEPISMSITVRDSGVDPYACRDVLA